MPTITHGKPIPARYHRYNWDALEVGSTLEFDIGEVNPKTLRNLAYRAGQKRKTKYAVHKNDDNTYSVHRVA